MLIQCGSDYSQCVCHFIFLFVAFLTLLKVAFASIILLVGAGGVQSHGSRTHFSHRFFAQGPLFVFGIIWLAFRFVPCWQDLKGHDPARARVVSAAGWVSGALYLGFSFRWSSSIGDQGRRAQSCLSGSRVRLRRGLRPAVARVWGRTWAKASMSPSETPEIDFAYGMRGHSQCIANPIIVPAIVRSGEVGGPS